MGQIILLFFCALIAQVIDSLAQPAVPLPAPAPLGGVPAVVPNLGPGGKPSIVNLPGVNPQIPGGGGDALTPEIKSDLPETLDSLKGEEALEIEFDFAAGSGLRLFGLDFFARPAERAGLDVTPVYEDYRVGPGDEVLIRAWGALDINLRLTVDRQGFINIPRGVGPVQVANLKASELEGFVKAQFGKIFRNFEMNVTLGRLRSIEVFVVGQARNPGKYTISAWSSLVNALLASGGPSGVGSMRSIQVKRGGQIVTTFDLYDLLMQGDKSKDVRLKHGDVVFIPARGNLAGITGQVKVPAVYELKGNEVVEDLLAFAEGFTATAFQGRLQIERIKDHKLREIKNLDWGKQSNRAELLRDGDLVHVVPISPRFDRVVTLTGHVAAPRRENWRFGMRVSDLIPNRADLIPKSYWDSKNNLILPEASSETITGERVSPDQVRRFRYLELIRGARKLLSEVNWEYATLQRINPDSLENEFITFNLGLALRENDPEHNLLLKPGDVVTIYKRSDIRLPKSKKLEFVTIEGEVNKPGLYEIIPGETLSQLVQRAGGFTEEAYVYAGVFTRESVRLEQQKLINASIIRIERELAQASAQIQARTVSNEAKSSIDALSSARAKSLETMRSTPVTGRVTLDINRDITKASQLPNLELKDGDTFTVPSKMDEIHVIGEVFNQQSSIWRQGTTALDSLAVAGGPTRFADIKQLFIIRANGTVVSRSQIGRGFSSIRMHPGDTLVIPEDMDYYNWKFELKEWVKIFSDFALGVAAIRVISN